MNYLQALAALRGQDPSIESPRFTGPTWFQMGQVPPELRLTPDEEMAISVAWACIRNIVDPIAASELKIYEEQGGKRVEQREGWLYWLLNVEPAPGYTSQGWGEVMITRALAGDSYAYLRPDGAGRVAAMQPLDPDRMSADSDGSGIVYVYQDPARGELRLLEREILHIRGPRTGGFFGASIRGKAAAALALYRAQEQYASAYYANGAYPGVLLKPPASSAPRSQEQKNEARTVWQKLFGGPRKKGGVGTLDPGWEVQIVETDAQKAQMVEARKFQITEILRYFGVPGHLVNLPDASQGYGKNLAELSLGFVRQTLEPWARRVEEEIRRKLMPERRGRGWWLEYDLSRLRKGAELEVAQAEDLAIKNSTQTVNEARALRGLPSVPGGDVPLFGGKPLRDVVKPPKPSPVVAPPPPAGEPPDGEDPEDLGDGGDGTTTGEDVARAAVALDRFARRLAARRTDLERKASPAKALAGLQLFRAEQLPALLEELSAAGMTRENALAAAEAAEGGEPAHLAAARLLAPPP